MIAPDKPKEDEVREADCPDCEGHGWHVGVRAACCGNTYASGACKGDCAIQEQFQEPCDMCGGSGKLPILTLQEDEVSPYLLKPRRTEEQARRDIEAARGKEKQRGD